MNIPSIDSSELIKNEKDKRCAPGINYEDGACISLEDLIEMAKAYNKRYTNNKIKLSEKLETLNPKKYKRYLVKEFSIRLDDVCGDQKCWVKQEFIKDIEKNIKNKLNNYTFRPNGPEGKFTWLNTYNVNDVMKQYENKHKDFKFLGAVPIDFDNLKNLEISKLNFDELYNNYKKKIGVVYNLDEHYKSGSHWVALYSDMNKGCIYFFDSYGVKPEERIRRYMRKVENYLKSIGFKKTDVRYNKTRHQYKNSECGVYSLNFIIRSLEGETFDEINGKRISDSEVNKTRDIYFR